MIDGWKKRTRWAAGLSAGLCLLVQSCSAPKHFQSLMLGPQSQHVDALLAERHPNPGADVTRFPLGASERSSRHLVYIRDRERPHTHPGHDLTVVLLRGRGTMWVSEVATPMREGDIATIDAGEPHYFVNEGEAPAAAFVVLSPPDDGSEPVFVEP